MIQGSNYPTPTYMSPYGHATWNQHGVGLPYPGHSNGVESSMMMMAAHSHHPTHNGVVAQNGIEASSSAYPQTRLDQSPPTGRLNNFAFFYQ